MIVYAGKQYGNEFNNGDEALFEDAKRPRDSQMFKITPWMQGWRWDWKKTNKNREPSLFHAYGFSLVEWANPVNNKSTDGIVWKRIRFKSKYSTSDFSSIAPYTRATWAVLDANDLLQYVDDAYGENGDAKATIKDERLEIQESWVYFIDMFAQFVYPSWYNYASNTSYPLYLGLLVEWKGTYADTQSRSCFYLDRLHETFATPIPKGTRISLGVAHGYTSASILVACWITAVRMD